MYTHLFVIRKLVIAEMVYLPSGPEPSFSDYMNVTYYTDAHGSISVVEHLRDMGKILKKTIIIGCVYITYCIFIPSIEYILRNVLMHMHQHSILELCLKL